MALCRCKKHLPRGNTYLQYIKPIGYPHTSSICGRKGCNISGFIWLNLVELNHFMNNNQRIFEFPTASTKVRVTDAIRNR